MKRGMAGFERVVEGKRREEADGEKADGFYERYLREKMMRKW